MSHASVRKDQERAIFLFKTVQSAVEVVGLAFLAIAMMFRHQYATTQSGKRRLRLATEQYCCGLPAMALQFAMVAMGAALRGPATSSRACTVQTGTVVIKHGGGAIPDLRMGAVSERASDGAAVATLLAIGGRRGVDLVLLHRREAYLRFPSLTGSRK